MGDSREKVESAEFYITSSRFVQQVHDAEPKYVVASPQMPVKVILPAKINRVIKSKVQLPDGSVEVKTETRLIDQPEDGTLKRAAPPAPADVHKPGKQPKGVPPNLVQRVGGDGRAADK